MEIAIVGSPEFTLGFQLAGIMRLHNPENDEEMSQALRLMLDEEEVGIIVVDAADLTRMPDKLRQRMSGHRDRRGQHPPRVHQVGTRRRPLEVDSNITMIRK